MRSNFHDQEAQNIQKEYSRKQVILTNSTIQQQRMIDEQDELDKQDNQLTGPKDYSNTKQDTNKNIWTYEQQLKLFQLHDQLGNKWGIISQNIQNQTDNSVKNHFYSKLRKSLRKLNKIINTTFKKQLKELKMIVLYKIIEATQQKHKANPQNNQQLFEISTSLKNRLLFFSYDQNQSNNYQKNPQLAHQLIYDVVNFSKQYRRKSKNGKKKLSVEDEQKDLLSPKSIFSNKNKKRFNSQYEQSQEGIPSDSSIFGSQISSANSQYHKKEMKQEEVIVTRRRAKSKEQTQIKRILQNQNKKSLKFGGSRSLEIEQFNDKNQCLQNLLKQSGILQNQYLPPLPQVMKKISSYQQSNQISNQILDEKQQNFHFFQQSQMQMRILPAKSQDHFNDPMLNQNNFYFFK